MPVRRAAAKRRRAASAGRRIEGGGRDARRRHALVAELGEHAQRGRPRLGLGVVEQRGQPVGERQDDLADGGRGFGRERDVGVPA